MSRDTERDIVGRLRARWKSGDSLAGDALAEVERLRARPSEAWEARWRALAKIGLARYEAGSDRTLWREMSKIECRIPAPTSSGGETEALGSEYWDDIPDALDMLRPRLMSDGKLLRVRDEAFAKVRRFVDAALRSGSEPAPHPGIDESDVGVSAEELREALRWAWGSLHDVDAFKRLGRDHACPECVPEGGDLVDPDFRCVRHRINRLLNGRLRTAPAPSEEVIEDFGHRFHEAFKRLEPSYGYDGNVTLMIAAAREVLSQAGFLRTLTGQSEGEG